MVSNILNSISRSTRGTLLILLAVPAIGGTITIAPEGIYGPSSDGPLAEASAFVHYPGRPAPIVSDTASLNVPVEIIFLGSTGSGKYRTCASFETLDFGDVDVGSFASVSVGSSNLQSPTYSSAVVCSTAVDFTYGVPQVVDVVLWAKVSADFLVRDSTRAFDVYASGTLNYILGYDYLNNVNHSLSYSWKPQALSANLESVPEPASAGTAITGLLALLYWGRRRGARARS